MAGLLDLLGPQLAGQVADKRGLGSLDSVQAPSSQQMLGGFPVPPGLTPQTSLDVPNGMQAPAMPSFASPASPPPMPNFSPPGQGGLGPPPFQPSFAPPGRSTGMPSSLGGPMGLPPVNLGTDPAAYRTQTIGNFRQNIMPTLPQWIQDYLNSRFGGG